MRLLVGIIVMLSLLFLFGGLSAVGMIVGDQSDIAAIGKTTRGYISQPLTEKYSMKQIDSVSSKYNYTFTSDNASGSANLP